MLPLIDTVVSRNIQMMIQKRNYIILLKKKSYSVPKVHTKVDSYVYVGRGTLSHLPVDL